MTITTVLHWYHNTKIFLTLSVPHNLLFSHVVSLSLSPRSLSSCSVLFSTHPSFEWAHQDFQARKTTDLLLHLVPLLPGSVYLVATWEADWKCKANCEHESKSMFASVGRSLDLLLSSEQRSAVESCASSESYELISYCTWAMVITTASRKQNLCYYF